MHETHLGDGVLGKSQHRFVLHVPPRLLVLAGAALVGSLLAGFGSLLLEMLRTSGR